MHLAEVPQGSKRGLFGYFQGTKRYQPFSMTYPICWIREVFIPGKEDASPVTLFINPLFDCLGQKAKISMF